MQTRRAVVAAIALAVSLVGCSAGAATPVPSPSPSPSPTESARYHILAFLDAAAPTLQALAIMGNTLANLAPADIEDLATGTRNVGKEVASKVDAEKAWLAARSDIPSYVADKYESFLTKLGGTWTWESAKSSADYVQMTAMGGSLLLPQLEEVQALIKDELK